MKEKKFSKKFYGATTIGEKGQVVIPAEAREAMKLNKGDKLLVFGMGCDMVAFSKLSNLEKIADRLSKRAEAIQEIIKKGSLK